MKRALFVVNNNVLHASYGAEQRSNILLKALLAQSYHVDLIYVGKLIDNYKTTPPNVSILYWNEGTNWEISNFSSKKRLLTYRMFPTSPQLESIVDHFASLVDYDIIVCRYLQIAALAGLYKYGNKLLLDIDDLPHQSFKTNIEQSPWPKCWYHKLMYKSMKRELQRWIANSKAAFLPNKEQAEEFQCIHLPNIPVETTSEPLISSTDNNILFIGRMDFSPNVKGVDHFIKNCWEQVLQAKPDAHLLIAGKGLDNDVRKDWLSYKNIDILGFVDSILDFYMKGNIVISPIFSGAGTNIKVIEALSLGKACLLSKFSTKGFEELIDHQTARVFHSDSDCVEHLLELLGNKDLCCHLAKNAFKKTRDIYSQEAINKILSAYL